MALTAAPCWTAASSGSGAGGDHVQAARDAAAQRADAAFEALDLDVEADFVEEAHVLATYGGEMDHARRRHRAAEAQL